MRFLVTFLANRAMFLLVLLLVLNAYVQTTSVGRDANLTNQIDTVLQTFRTLSEAFR